jgi:excisionase family DNA binding protein
MDKLYTIAEVATLLRISKPTLYRLMASGEIKSVKLGGRTLFKESEVERFVNSLDSGKNEVEEKA